MSKESNKLEFRSVLNEFEVVTKEVYNSHAFTAGYYNSLLNAMFEELPATKQKMFLDQISRSLVKEKALRDNNFASKFINHVAQKQQMNFDNKSVV